MLHRNVLIFHAGALGDFVQTWPLSLALGRLFPQSRVIFITQRQKGILAERILRLESMDVETGWHNLYGNPDRLPDLCRGKLESAHSVFTFVAKPGDPWTQAVASIAPHAQLVCLEPGPSQQILESLAGLPAIHSAVAQIRSSIADKGIGSTKPTDSGPIAIHPGSGSPDKCWPIDSYLHLIEALHAAGHHCRIILGDVELERWAADQIHRLQSAAETIHPAAYIDLFNELSACSAFIGNDSGPGHLAGIIGLPSIILFGPTDPAVWKPLGPRITAIRNQPLSSLSHDQVLQAVLSALPRTLSSAQAE